MLATELSPYFSLYTTHPENAILANSRQENFQKNAPKTDAKMPLRFISATASSTTT
jgi:hypothetical protein